MSTRDLGEEGARSPAPARLSFKDSASYWEARYRRGGTSGAGSYNRLALFKAAFLNHFVRKHSIATVVEFGCGDGNQLSLAEYPSYVGVDISETALGLCRARFAGDATKSFADHPPAGTRFDLAMSLDVIFHLVEDAVFEAYMAALFEASHRFVIIYSSDMDQAEFDKLFPGITSPHVRHRRFSNWIAANAPGWRLLGRLRNRFPYDPAQPHQTSFADFHVFVRKSGS